MLGPNNVAAAVIPVFFNNGSAESTTCQQAVLTLARNQAKARHIQDPGGPTRQPHKGWGNAGLSHALIESSSGSSVGVPVKLTTFVLQLVWCC
jgi:hypothetical protein